VEISLLAQHFARAAAHGPVDLERDAHVQLVRYGWPGNVLELKNTMEQAVVLGGVPIIRLEHLPPPIRAADAPPETRATQAASPSMSGASRRPRVAAIQPEVEEVERRHIERALAANHGNRTHTAGALGISRRALLYKLAKYGLS
jgi:two-component system response regulator AtoC